MFTNKKVIICSLFSFNSQLIQPLFDPYPTLIQFFVTHTVVVNLAHVSITYYVVTMSSTGLNICSRLSPINMPVQ